VDVARGSIEYSAVTQPLPVPRRNAGTLSSTVAAHNTRVLPVSINTDPSAVTRKSGVIFVVRSWSVARPSTLMFFSLNPSTSTKRTSAPRLAQWPALLIPDREAPPDAAFWKRVQTPLPSF
jgi:hypothetical protein